MDAIEHLRGGDLGGALKSLQDQVRKAPSDAKLRIFLFQLLSVMGDWDRALTQLRVCGQLDAQAVPMSQTYREAIGCEFVRERVFRGETAPLLFGEPKQWLALLLEALGALGRGNYQAAADLRAQAFEMAPATSGTANGEAFEWIADADMRLGPVLEIIMNGRYYWAPFNTIRALKLEEPTDLRDRVWTPGELTWTNGGQVPVLIPTRYPGVDTFPRDGLKLSRETEWSDVGGETYVGLGQRVFATDRADISIMDLRHLALDVEATGTEDMAAIAEEIAAEGDAPPDAPPDAPKSEPESRDG